MHDRNGNASGEANDPQTAELQFDSPRFSTYGFYWLRQLVISFHSAAPFPSWFSSSFQDLTRFRYRKWQTRRKAGTQIHGSAKELADRQAAEGLNGF